MSRNWPQPSEWWTNRQVISVLGNGYGFIRGANPASTAWPAANRAIYAPIVIDGLVTIAQLFCVNGATASGNIDVGLYDVNGVRLVSAGSTAQSGTSAIQVFNVTDTVIGPGCYFIGVAKDDVTGTVEGATTTVAAAANGLRLIGLYQQASAFPLPAVATFATIATNLSPWCGFTIGTVL